ncbi:molybdopterin cofactor-binding domain-containing protein [Nocardia heshunensis]
MIGRGLDQHIQAVRPTEDDLFPDAPPGWLVGSGSALSRSGAVTPDGRLVAQLFQVAVNPGTGEWRILRSVHATDTGTGMDPSRRRQWVEAGVAQALGAALSEPLPTAARVPRTEIACTRAADSPGAQAMRESPFDPVAPALANALRDATGIRFTELPLTRDRIWLALHEKQTRRSARTRDIATPTRAELALLTDFQVP